MRPASEPPVDGPLAALRRRCWRRSGPAAQRGPEHRDPGAAGERHVHPDELPSGRCVSYWSSPTAPCSASSTQRIVSGRCTSLGRSRRRASHHSATAARLNTNAISRVAVDHEVHRAAPVEAQAVDLLPRRAARVGPGRGGGGAREDRQRAQRHQRARAQDEASGRWRRRAACRRAPRPPRPARSAPATRAARRPAGSASTARSGPSPSRSRARL